MTHVPPHPFSAEPPIDSGPPLDMEPPQPVGTRADKPVLKIEEFVAILAAGAFGDIALRSMQSAVSTSLAFLAVICAMVIGRRLRRVGSVVLLAGTVLLVPWLTLRSGAPITWFSGSVLVVTLGLAAGLARRGELLNLRASQAIGFQLSAFGEWVYGLPMVGRLFGGAAGRDGTSVLRGVLIVSPVLLLFGLLLASADAIFARAFQLDQPAQLLGHLVLAGICAGAGLGLVSRVAHVPADSTGRGADRGLGATEIRIVLGSVAVMFAIFVAIQGLFWAVEGGDRVLETAGLTRAEYARSGFWQLLWVSGLSLCFVSTVRALAKADAAAQTAVRRYGIAVLSLTLMIATTSLSRLDMHVEAFALTQKRLWAAVAIVWIFGTVGAYILNLGGLWRSKSWFPGSVALSGVVLCLALNVLNPDAFIVKYNLTHTPTDRDVDLLMLTELSADAVPPLIEARSELSQSQRDDLDAALCARDREEVRYGLLGWNRAVDEADEALEALCSG